MKAEQQVRNASCIDRVAKAYTNLPVMHCLVYAQPKDSYAILKQLHDRMEAEQQVGNAALTCTCHNSMH